MKNYENILEKIIKQLIKHEGLKRHPYKDTKGKITIGIGRNLTDRGLGVEEVIFLVKNDIAISYNDLNNIFNKFNKFSVSRKIALIDMMFNLGYNKFSTFKKMIKAINDNDWERASAEALNSVWAKQVGERAKTIAKELSMEA